MKKLNFGCGTDIKKEWDNCDIQEAKGIISFDFNEFPYPIGDNTYDYIQARQIINLVDKPDKVLYELRRIAKPNAIIKILVPYWHNKGACNDIQARYMFNENSFITFVEQDICKINKELCFEIIKLEKQPTNVGKFIPEWFRDKLDLFFSGLISNMDIELKVIKK